VPTRALPLAALIALSSFAAPGCGPPPAARESSSPTAPAARARFCRNVELMRDGAACLDEVSAETQKHRGATYVLEERDGRVAGYRCVNGAGGPCAEPESYTLRFENGALAVRASFNELGVPLGQLLCSPLPGGKTRRAWRRVSGEGDEGLEVVTWDARGFVAERRFVDAANEPRVDDEGVYGYRYTRDEQGRIVAVQAIDGGGRPMLNRYSWGIEKTLYDPVGNSTEIQRLDIDGKLSRNGISRSVFERDAWGNGTRSSYFDAGGKPAVDKQEGAFTTERRDDHGNLIEARYFGADGQPYIAPSGAAGYRAEHDAAGRGVAVVYLDTAGNPARLRRGHARATFRYDARGRLTAERYFDEKGEPVIIAEGYAIVAHGYNDTNDEVLTAYLGPHERPMVRKGQGSAVARSFDDAHQLVGLAFLDERGKPVDLWRGYAGVRFAYDASGKRVRTTHLDSSGQPVEMVGVGLLRVAFAGQGLDLPGVTRSRDEARARAEEALRLIRGGLTFPAALRIYGDDGGLTGDDIGEIAVGALQPELSRTVAQLATGSVSDVVETISGFFILQRLR
jgi:YD repeat-containing protein